MPSTTTFIGGGTYSTPAYSQSAGHVIVVGVNNYNAQTPYIVDTAGNSYVPAGPSVHIGSWYSRVFYCVNCVGNASNVISLGGQTPTYCGIMAWDIAGANTLDAYVTATGTSAAPSVPSFATAYADEAIINFVGNGTNATTGSLPFVGSTPMIDDGSFGQTNTSYGAHLDVTSAVSSTTVSTTLSGSATWVQFGISFYNASPVNNLAVVNTDFGGQAGGSVTPLTTAGMNLTPGSLLVLGCAFYGYFTSNPITSITDTAGNNANYTLVPGGSALNSSSGYVVFYYVKNCLGNATNIITVNVSPTVQYSSIFAWQISGASTTSPFDSVGTANVGAYLLTTGPFSTVAVNTIVCMMTGGLGGGDFIVTLTLGGITDDTQISPSTAQGAGHAIFTTQQNNITPGFYEAAGGSMPAMVAAVFAAAGAPPPPPATAKPVILFIR
jgi:hypothetical protein